MTATMTTTTKKTKGLGAVQLTTLVAMGMTGGAWHATDAAWYAGPKGNACKTIRVMQVLERRGMVRHVPVRVPITDIAPFECEHSGTVPTWVLTTAGWEAALAANQFAYLDAQGWVDGCNRPPRKTRKNPAHLVRNR